MMDTSISFLFQYQDDLQKTIIFQLQSMQLTIPVGKDIISNYIKRFSDFALRGKLLRGSMTLFSYEIHGGKDLKKVCEIASALEIIHSSILVHDDILDHAPYRRGKPTIHTQYQEKFSDTYTTDASYGIHMALAGGDIGYCLGFSIISHVLSTHPNKEDLLSFISQEFLNVFMTQMVEYDWGVRSYEPSIQEILDIYRYKTARYSFVLPFLLGAKLSDFSDHEQNVLILFAESLGMIFQIHDDWLDLFGDNKTGKIIGNDIRDNKKTLMRKLLLSVLSKKERQKVDTIFGCKKNSFEEIKYVQEMFISHKIEQKIRQTVSLYEKDATTAIDAFPLSPSIKAQLQHLVSYSLTRVS